MGLRVEPATHDDRHAMVAVLGACGLSPFGILSPGTLYWVCRTEGELVGTCGIELGDGCALLRSLCVARERRRSGIAEQLVTRALLEASRLDLRDVYLFSKDTGGYFERLGWREVPIAEVITRLPQAPQVRRYEGIGWYPDERAFVRRVGS